MEKVCLRCEFRYPLSAVKCKACNGALTTEQVAPIEDNSGAVESRSDVRVIADSESRAPRPPKLRVNIAKLNLGAVRKGAKVEKTILIENVGDGDLEGYVTVNVPWLSVSAA